MRRTPARILAIGTTTALLGLAGSPATAAEPVAVAEAGAVRLNVAGHPAESGSYRVSHDGTRQNALGSNQPAVRVLSGQSLVGVGTLAQDATTRVQGGQGYSAACAGVAGDGASLIAAGDGNCLDGGDNVRLTAGDLRVPELRVVGRELGKHLPADAAQQIEGITGQADAGLAPLAHAVGDAPSQVRSRFGGAGLFVDLGAVQAHCAAGPGEAAGDATIADAAAYLQTPDGKRVYLVKLPVHPGPNTKVVTGLDKVADAILAAVSMQLRKGLDGALSELEEQAAAKAREAIVKEVSPRSPPSSSPWRRTSSTRP